MFCISVSFQKTPLPIRQKFAFSGEERGGFLSELIKKQKITGGVVLSTCNRSEIYFTGRSLTGIEEFLSAYKGLKKEEIKKYCLYYQGKKAVRHLYRVACGLDSMILGEDEILHQMREAYCFSEESGFTNSELNMIFQGAFHCAKRSKTATRFSTTPLSIGTLTANAVEQFLKGGSGGPVLVIGATGKIGSIVAKDLIAKGIPVIGTIRRHQHTQQLYFLNHESMEWLDFEQRYEAVPKAAAIVSATSSPHYTLTREAFAHRAKPGVPYLLIDLAVPYDIDQELGNEENIKLLDIDHFQTLSRENSNIKLGELDKAESILDECVEDILKKLYLRDFAEQMPGKWEEPWFRQMAGYFRDALSSDQLLQVLDRIRLM